LTLTRISQPHISQPHSDRLPAAGLRRKITGSLAAIALAGSLTAVGASVAQAQPQVTRKATVVKIVTRAPFGKMLATVHGRSLYYLPVGSCKGTCLSAWPPLLMPRGKTIALGARCLETVKFGGRHQVAYRGKRLYLFSGDSGHSVTGNGLAGFKVAKVKTGPCSS
jgi:predicted lipoprotein with Yx(FWY)xxD motif